MENMGIIRKILHGIWWIWRRVSDLSTLSWIFPGGSAVITVLLSRAQNLPLALTFVLTLIAFLVVLIFTVVWRTHFGQNRAISRPAPNPSHAWLGADPPLLKGLRDGLAGDLGVGPQRPTIEAPPSPHRTPDEKVVELANAHEARQRADILKDHIQKLTQRLTPPPPHMENGDARPLPGGTVREQALLRARREHVFANEEFDRVKQELQRQGFPMDGWDNAAKEAEARIKGDALYLTIVPYDAEFAWETGEEKREWHLQRAVVQAKLGYLTAMADKYEREADTIKKGRP